MPPSDKSGLLTDLSAYIYGTGRLGDTKIAFDDRVRVARAAMQAGIWFHTSHTYGETLSVLRAAFDQDRSQVPPLIVKIGWSSLEELREIIQQNLDPLAIDSLALGQLCLTGALAEGYANGGACYAEFARLKQQGLVKRFVLEVFPWTSPVALKALRAGYPQGLVDGYIFYLNPLQRFASNELWDELQARGEPIIAMRTVAGGPVQRLRDMPSAAGNSYLQQRAVEVTPVFESSGVANWTEFCVRYAHSLLHVRATVGATSRIENLQEYLAAARDIQPLPAGVVEEIASLQRRWSDEVDMKAEPWTM
jgi:aryl-alcohol dehydrogenase-like predicted oxidoreductase